MSSQMQLKATMYNNHVTRVTAQAMAVSDPHLPLEEALSALSFLSKYIQEIENIGWLHKRPAVHTN